MQWGAALPKRGNRPVSACSSTQQQLGSQGISRQRACCTPTCMGIMPDAWRGAKDTGKSLRRVFTCAARRAMAIAASAAAPCAACAGCPIRGKNQAAELQDPASQHESHAVFFFCERRKDPAGGYWSCRIYFTTQFSRKLHSEVSSSILKSAPRPRKSVAAAIKAQYHILDIII